MAAPSVPVLHVAGGAGGVEAEFDDLATLGDSSGELAGTLARVSAVCHAALVDPAVLASAVLDPAGVARFEVALLDALDGPDGLTALAAGFAERAGVLASAAAVYRAADAASAELADDLRWAAGFLWPVTVAGVVAQGLTDPAGTAPEAAALVHDPERWLTEHPGVVDDLTGAAPGFATWLDLASAGRLDEYLGGSDVAGAARRLGRLWPDGRPVVTELPLAGEPDSVPPAGFGDLVAGLDRRNRLAGNRDEIDVRVVEQPGGGRGYVVDLPGTKTFDLPAGLPSPATNGMGTNLRVLGGDTTTRERAVAEALTRAGAGPDDPVMLVGHSQGGMVAAQAAADAGSPDFDFTVTHVVTAGAPIARADVPPEVQVLALENEHDIVPHLDARENDAAANLTTVTFADQHGDVVADHATDLVYLPAARALDAVTDPSVTAFRDSAAAFLARPGGGTTSSLYVFELSRE